MHPSGKFVWVSNRGQDSLACFAINANGELSARGHTPTEKTPRGFNIDPRGKFLLAVGMDSASLTVHAIDQDSGELKNVKQYPMGKQPNWVEIVDRIHD